MALDGIMMAGLAAELDSRLVGGKIAKIAQPEKDELLFTIKNQKNTWRLLISASASLPLLYFTEQNKQSPMTAPNFCMLLRKHIGNGRIMTVSQPGLERVICLEIEHLDELGDKRLKRLYIEIMGKHSNIIFCSETDVILDSIKHISSQVSSVREVLAGRPYFVPKTVEKKDPLTITEAEFLELTGCGGKVALSEPTGMDPIQKTLYKKLTGLSPIAGIELCHLAALDGDLPANQLSEAEATHLYHMLSLMMEDVKERRFSPNMIQKEDEPVEFSALPLTCYEGGGYEAKSFDSVSALLEAYYASKNVRTRIRQKSADLRRVVQNALERGYKKYDLQTRQLKDTQKRDKYKIYGELLNTYGYELKGGEKALTCLNHYTGEEIKIPLDGQLTAMENSRKYFDRYNKLKRTFEALTQQIEETKREIGHLESVSAALDIALKEEDLVQIKEELMECGYLKRRRNGEKKPKVTSQPFHYLSSDGFHVYVGKNNYQNEEITYKLAGGNDWWFHAKGIPGSHVIVKTEGKELPDRVFEEASALAAYYSKGRQNERVEVDYIQRKHVRKVTGAAPGFVIYHTNYSLIAEPKLSLKQVP